MHLPKGRRYYNMKKTLAQLFFFLIGWTNKSKVTPEVEHSVMIAAPHTSNWDLPIALAAFWLMGIDLKYFIKDDYTRAWYGGFFRWTGAIGVNRQQKNNLTDYAVQLLKERKMVLMVPAEGTRKRVEKWRTGFYHIARRAGVPISLGTLDYKNKVADVLDTLRPSGNFEADMRIIEDQYAQIEGKHPEHYNPKIF